MISIGIRVTPQKVFYAVLEEKESEINILNVSYVNIPVALEIPNKLSFLRSTIVDILNEYRVLRAGIRLTEPSARSLNVLRLNIEGVMQELLASSTVEGYFCGAIATIASLLGLKNRTLIKKYIDGEENFCDLDGWESLKKEERESILTAAAALNIKGE